MISRFAAQSFEKSRLSEMITVRVITLFGRDSVEKRQGNSGPVITLSPANHSSPPIAPL